MSDLHLGHENTLYETFWYVVDRLIGEIELQKIRYDINKIFLIIVGDMVSGTGVYRNQYLQNTIDKNEAIISLGAYFIHLVIEKLEQKFGIEIETYIVLGNHEGSKKPMASNFPLAIQKRLSAYYHFARYVSIHVILNIARDLCDKEFNLCAYHGYGGADYNATSPSLVRELTRFHSQCATEKGIIINRFVHGHVHWLQIGHSVLGIVIDSLGGFQGWEQKMSWRESGLILYVINEDYELDVRGISGLKMQLEEKDNQRLHWDNMRYVASLIEDSISYELDIGILQPRQEGERK